MGRAHRMTVMACLAHAANDGRPRPALAKPAMGVYVACVPWYCHVYELEVQMQRRAVGAYPKKKSTAWRILFPNACIVFCRQFESAHAQTLHGAYTRQGQALYFTCNFAVRTSKHWMAHTLVKDMYCILHAILQ